MKHSHICYALAVYWVIGFTVSFFDLVASGMMMVGFITFIIGYNKARDRAAQRAGAQVLAQFYFGNK